ncbi:hypothetical protein [Neisseria gonorrhoeae]|nr:hypothetical protein [Neisseria gonorrhoeae]MCC9030352.1 hypothetical protein [Neisseria gonorrhoeae]
MKLKEGQRVTVKPTVVLRTAFVTIRKYKDDGCGADTAIWASIPPTAAH